MNVSDDVKCEANVKKEDLDESQSMFGLRNLVDVQLDNRNNFKRN